MPTSKGKYNVNIHLLGGQCFSPTRDNNSKQEKGTSDVETDYEIKSIPNKKNKNARR